MRLRKSLPALVAAATVLLTASVASADWLSDLSNPFEEALNNESYGLALGLIYLAGLVTSLTPCVYPMIAITVSVFGASEAKSKLHGAGLSTMYVLGICALFTPLGLAAGLSGDFFGSFLANSWVWVGLSVILLALSLGMFGAYELSLPPSMQNKLATMGGLGPKGAFVLGMVGGLIAAPCTGPVLGGLLAWIGTTGNWKFGAAALFVYALGVGTLTWLVGTFAVSLPKSGRWLESVKSVLGLGLVATALFFLANNAFHAVAELVEKTPYVLGGFAVLLVFGLVLGAIHLSYHGATKLVIARKTTGLIASAIGAAGVVLWLNAAPVAAEMGTDSNATEIAWMTDYEAARTLALSEERPLLVDFGASWCGACQELDRHTFSDQRVITEGQRFVPVRVDLSAGQDLATGRALLASYEQTGLPLVVMHHADGEEAARVTSFMEPEQMVQLMRDVH